VSFGVRLFDEVELR